MDLSGRINEELLICQICYVKYTQTDRQPKLLSCSHTFCAECIKQYLLKRKRPKHKFPCPLCRKETNLSKDGVSGLTNNLTVMGLIDILDQSAEEEEFSPKGGSVRSSSKSPKHRPGLRHVAWSSPEMGRQYGSERARSRTAPSMQCDNCDAVATGSLMCGHVFCAHCTRKCENGDCIQCTTVGVGARSRNAPKSDRPPPLNPEYDDSSPETPTRNFKPPVPKRTSAVKPIGSLSRTSHLHTCTSAPSLSQPAYGTLTRGQRRSDTSLPCVHEDGASISPDELISNDRNTPRNERNPRPHTVHLSSTLPINSTFGTALRSQMVLPRSTSSTHSLPTMGNTSPQHRIFSPPQPPQRRISSEGTALASPIRCLTRFGRFSPTRLQTNAFHQPTHIASSQFTNDWAVVDSVNMTLQIFDQDGGYISMFKVLGIKSTCFLSAERLAVSSHRGVEIYQMDGTKLHDLQIGRTDAVVTYKHGGFVAVQPRSLHFYSPTFSELRVIKSRSAGKLRRSTSFQQITAIAVMINGDIVVLDSKLNDITVVDTSGKVKLLIDPAQEPCGKLLNPEAIAVDRIGNIIVSDSGNRRLLRFSANGMFSRCLLNFSLGTSTPGDVTVHGVAVGEGGAMAVVLAGSSMAEVRVYQLV